MAHERHPRLGALTHRPSLRIRGGLLPGTGLVIGTRNASEGLSRAHQNPRCPVHFRRDWDSLVKVRGRPAPAGGRAQNTLTTDRPPSKRSHGRRTWPSLYFGGHRSSSVEDGLREPRGSTLRLPQRTRRPVPRTTPQRKLRPFKATPLPAPPPSAPCATPLNPRMAA